MGATYVQYEAAEFHTAESGRPLFDDLEGQGGVCRGYTSQHLTGGL